MQKRKKRPLTLMEIMIVIFLIGLIGSVVGYNMKGSIDEGKYFKSQQAAAQTREILLLEVAQGADIDNVVKDPKTYLEHSKLARNVKNLLKDGWGNSFDIVKRGKHDIKVSTKKLEQYRAHKNKHLGEVVEEEAEEQEDAQ